MFAPNERYARNDLQEWLEENGGTGKGSNTPRSFPASPPMKKKKGVDGGGEGRDGERKGYEDAGYAVNTGTN